MVSDIRALWMRYVDFEEIKNMLHIINQNNGKLRAGQLEQLCLKMGVLLNKNDEGPLSRSTRYRYRKALENLGLVQNKKGIYYVSWDERVFHFLCSTRFKEIMNESAKEILKEIILQNKDCKEYFFDIFLNKKFYSLDEFRSWGSHIFIETKSMRTPTCKECELKNEYTYDKNNKSTSIILRNPNGKQIELKNRDQIFAIYSGVRLWSLKLEITNEIITNFNEGRIIYPVNPNYDENILRSILLSKIESDKNSTEWINLHIPTFVREAVLNTHFLVNLIKEFLSDLRRLHPDKVMFVPTSTVFIDVKTPYNKQDPAFRNSYLYDKRKGYISHLRINKSIQNEVGRWRNLS
jgi:hypothetical protein